MHDVSRLFHGSVRQEGNFLTFPGVAPQEEQAEQTSRAFSTKWTRVDRSTEDVEALAAFQYRWFLSLYGFGSEEELAEFLRAHPVIVDMGCGLGYKSAWLAGLAPHSTVIGVDSSSAVQAAARRYSQQSNLLFASGDISRTPFRRGSVDFVVCDQVLQHTSEPELTFAHLASLVAPGGQFACYVYARKALPRELLDDYFRSRTHSVTDEEMWALSEQLTELGRRLSDLKVSFDCPAIPLLGIAGGPIDVQRFVYWNFLKCFWRPEWSFELCQATNYDWYAPSNARRFSREEFTDLIRQNQLETIYFHAEEACYSGRFRPGSESST